LQHTSGQDGYSVGQLEIAGGKTNGCKEGQEEGKGREKSW
jgi:hypothetical protein